MAGTKRHSSEISAPLPSIVIKRLAREYGDILANKHGVDYVSVEPQTPDDLSRWKGWIKGPSGTPYEGGLFRIRLSVSSEYPYKPPVRRNWLALCRNRHSRVLFLYGLQGLQFDTKVYHCNIDSSGGVCLNVLKSDWRYAVLPIVLVNFCSQSLISTLRQTPL